MHFVDPGHMADYRAGTTPEVIQNHEAGRKPLRCLDDPSGQRSYRAN